MFQTKFVEKIKTHILCSITFFFFPPKIVPFMRKCGKILYSLADHRWQYGACGLHVGYVSLQTHTHTHTHTHTGCVIFFAFPLQWLHERAWMLCYTYIACIVELMFVLYSDQCLCNTRLFQTTHYLHSTYIYIYVSVYRLILLLAPPQYCYYSTITVFPPLSKDALSVSRYSPVACYKVCLTLPSHFPVDVTQIFSRTF